MLSIYTIFTVSMISKPKQTIPMLRTFGGSRTGEPGTGGSAIDGSKIDSVEFAVNPIGLGTMPLAINNRPQEPEAIKVIHAALDNGINFIDTADVYCLDHRDIGYCERLIAKALKTWKNKGNNDNSNNGNSNSGSKDNKGNTNKIVVATKGGLERPNGDWTVNARPEHLLKACEASLKALETDCIDLYQLHAPDASVPFADSIGALEQLQRTGKIRYIGLSNVRLNEIKEAQKIVDIVSIQNRCNIFDVRSFQDGVISYCEEQGIIFIPYSPMGGSREKSSTAKDPILLKIAEKYSKNYLGEHLEKDSGNNLKDNTQKNSITPFQILLAWFVQKSPIMLPIPGAGRIESAISSARAMDIILDEEDITAIDSLFLLSR